MIISAAIAGAIFKANRSSVGSLIAGFLSAILTVWLINSKFLSIENESKLSYLLTMIAPIILFAIRALQVAGIQEATGDMRYGTLNIVMKVNKFLSYGMIIGVILSLVIFIK